MSDYDANAKVGAAAREPDPRRVTRSSLSAIVDRPEPPIMRMVAQLHNVASRFETVNSAIDSLADRMGGEVPEASKESSDVGTPFGGQLAELHHAVSRLERIADRAEYVVSRASELG